MNVIKSIFFLTVFVCVISSCQPTKEEVEQELRNEDSIANIQSNDAVNRANALFETDTLKADTVKSVK